MAITLVVWADGCCVLLRESQTIIHHAFPAGHGEKRPFFPRMLTISITVTLRGPGEAVVEFIDVLCLFRKSSGAAFGMGC